jgi:hypothetical protein
MSDRELMGAGPGVVLLYRNAHMWQGSGTPTGRCTRHRVVWRHSVTGVNEAYRCLHVYIDISLCFSIIQELCQQGGVSGHVIVT